MRGTIYQFEDLQEICQPGKKPRLATVEAWCRAQGIPFKYDARGGIWTTIQAINTALGVKAANDDSAALAPEDLF